MRARTIWCTTLVLLCHHALWPQAVTKQLPAPHPVQSAPQTPAAAPAADAGSTSVPQSAAPPASQPDPQAVPPFTLPGNLDSTTDPAFAPPQPTDTPTPSIPPDSPPPPETPGAPAVADSAISTPGSNPPAPADADNEDPATAYPLPIPQPGVPIHIEADTQSSAGDLYTLDGRVLIGYKQYIVRADHATYDEATSQVNARGHLSIDGGPSDEHVLADHGTMNLDAHTAHFYQVTGTLGVRAVTRNRFVFTAPNPFAIAGEELLQLGPGNYEVLRGTMTSCRLPNPDWKLLARTILVNDGEARARNSFFELRKLPIFFLPYVSHPVAQDHRQSGFLIPIFGNSTTKGFITGEEYYQVLGRSADLTLGTQYFSRRGFSPLAQFRYRGPGEDFALVRLRALLDRLPENQNQGGVDLSAHARRQFSPTTYGVADVEYLSSYIYRQAFEENYTAAINSEVKSQAFLLRQHDGYAESVRFERYQSFRSDNPGDEIRVLHTPAFHLDALDHSLGPALDTPRLSAQLFWGGEAAATAMSRSEPGYQTSRFIPRVDLHPHLALPVSFAGWNLRGEAGLRETFYGRSQNPGPVGAVPTERHASLNRTAFLGELTLRPPALQRDFTTPVLQHWLGGELRHSIEPELHYRYVTGINNFRSVLRFDSADVLSNTNELEYGLTQRLFLRHLHPHPCKGEEALGPAQLCGGGTVDWLTWRVAQKYFFNPTFGGAITPGVRNVLDTTLDFTGIAFLASARPVSPVISRLRLRTSGATDLEWDLDYDTRKGRLQASNISAAYRLRDTYLSIADYRLHTLGADSTDATVPTPTTSPSGISNFNQLRIAAIYGSPTKRGLSAGVTLGYDFTLTQMQYTSGQAGYNRDCCGVSFEVRRYALGSVRDDTQYLFSFTLAGVGAAGNLNRALRVF